MKVRVHSGITSTSAQNQLRLSKSAELRTVPTFVFVLRRRSAHLEILGFPMGGAY